MQLAARPIQNALYRYNKFDRRHAIVAPNINTLLHEADLLSLTDAHVTHEYEIKISRSDYRADFKKAEKHLRLYATHRLGLDPHYYGDPDSLYVPNYFWFVTPHDLIRPEEVPPYAGLIYAHQRDETAPVALSIEREAPRLHRHAMTDTQRAGIHTSLATRFWTQRLNDERAIIEQARQALWAELIALGQQAQRATEAA